MESVTLSFKAELRTRQLSMNILPEGREERHEVIHSLFESGLNDGQSAGFPQQVRQVSKNFDVPPYPSEAFYNAKLWRLCGKQGAKRALIWNVAG